MQCNKKEERKKKEQNGCVDVGNQGCDGKREELNSRNVCMLTGRDKEDILVVKETKMQNEEIEAGNVRDVLPIYKLCTMRANQRYDMV